MRRSGTAVRRGGITTPFLWAAGWLVVALIAASIIPCLRFLPALLAAGEPGFHWRYDARARVMTVTAVAPGSPAAAGLLPGDRITRIMGREPSPGIDLWGPPGRWVLRPGDRLEVVVDRGGDRRRLSWVLDARPWYRVTLAAGGWRLGVDQAFHAAFLIAVLATWGLGAWVLRQKPDLLSARALAGLSWALALAQLGAVVAHAPEETIPAWLYRLTFANDGWARLTLAAGIYFFLVFPEPKPILCRYPRLVAAIVFLPAIVLLLAHGVVAHSMWRFQFLEGQPERAQAIALLEAVDLWGYAFPAAVILLGLAVYSYRTAQRGPARRQLAVLSLAAVPLLLYALLASFALLAMGAVPRELSLLSPLAFLVWPAALAYAILTHGAFDVSRAVRRGVAYTASTAAVAVLCFLLVALVGQQAIERLGPGYTGLIVAGAALLAQPVWSGVQRWVDRQFGRDRRAVLRRLEILSGEIATILDPQPLASALVERVPAALGAGRAVLFQRTGENGDFIVAGASGLDASDPALASLAETVARRCAMTGPAALYVPREDLEPLGLPPEVAEVAEASGLVLWTPLGRRGESELLLALGWKRGEDVYTQEEIALLRVIGTQAVSAWETIRLIREREARLRVEQEIAMGQAIQARLLPPTPLCVGDYRVDARCESAAQVGGDFYNLFEIGAGDAGRAKLGIVLGDVSGKGVPGALYMAVVSSLIEGLSQGLPVDVRPAQLLGWAGERLHPKLRPLRMFVTAVCAVLDPASGRLALASAGQTPPILWRAGGQPEFVRLSGLPLGARPQASYEEQSLFLQPGDLCILLSDGLLDQSDPRGYEELRRRLSPSVLAAPETLLDTLYTLPAEAEPDDRTALLLSRGLWPGTFDNALLFSR